MVCVVTDLGSFVVIGFGSSYICIHHIQEHITWHEEVYTNVCKNFQINTLINVHYKQHLILQLNKNQTVKTKVQLGVHSSPHSRAVPLLDSY